MSSSKKYKKLVVITSRFPFPLEKGDKLRAYYQIKELAKHYSIHLISLSENEVNAADKEKLNEICSSISIYKISFFQRWLGVLLQFLTSKPFQVGYFTSYSIKRKIHTLLNNIKPDHIYCQLIRPAEYVKDYHSCAKTIDYMDALSKGIERRIDTANWYKKPFFKSEFHRLKNYEHKIFDYFEHHTIISEQDRNVIFHKERNRIAIVPNGVSADFINFKASTTKKYDLVFTGNMNYPPNVEACKFIANEIMTSLEGKTLVLSGASPNDEVKSLAKKNITVTGWVDDIKQIYTEGKIFVAPMFIGTGLQNKLLEAMALGIPCITTTLANNALKATPNKSVIIANTKEEFVTEITQLLKNENLQKSIAENAKLFVKENYNWVSSTNRLIERIES